MDDGNPASGVYDFQFSLFDAAGGGSADRRHAIGGRRRPSAAGLFTVDLDFGVARSMAWPAGWRSQSSATPTRVYTTLAPWLP